MALVSDISGVCSSRETRVMIPSPMNVASMKTKSIVMKSVAGAVFMISFRARHIWAETNGSHYSATAIGDATE